MAQRDVMPSHGEAGALPRRICLLVLGMHRSGTSAMTRVISLLGADLPKTLLGASPSNVRGHWEPASLVAQHDRLLEQIDSSWDDWRKLDPAAFPPSLREEAARGFHALVDEEYGASPLLVLKDPRICRFVPFVTELLAARNIATRYVLMLRNPLAVVASLLERNGMTPGFCALMWLRHMLDAEAATRRAPRAIVSYENLLLDWRAAMRTVGARVGIRWPCPIEVSGPQVEAFLSAEMQHHAPSRHELAARPDIADWVKAAYDALRALERDADDEAACRTLDRIAAEFDAVAPVFAAAMFPELAARERSIAAELQAQHAHAFDELRGTVAARDQRIADLQAEAMGREALLAASRSEIEVLRTAVAARESELAGSQGELAAAKVQIESEAEAARINAGRLREELEVRNGEIEALRDDAGALRGEVATRELQLATTRDELAAAKMKSDELASELDRLRQSNANIERELATARERITAQRVLKDLRNQTSTLEEGHPFATPLAEGRAYPSFSGRQQN